MDEKALRIKIQELIEKFERVRDQDKYKSYNEENTKKDFILPLFRALGWNVDDSEEVKAEEKISKKRVDYAFRINGVNKFFLEAKALKEYTSDPKYIAQAIEYAWNKSVPWAILSNFETLRVFNAEFEFDEKSPLKNVVLDLKYNDYLDTDFEKLLWLSKESFEQGVLDKNEAILRKKARKLPIDKQLLADFTEYRNILTKDILKHNQSKNLSEDNLDEIVQRILDRLIFIRTCEDKEIESEKLESLVRMYSDNEGKLYKELNKKFREYDKGYNSKLFREHICEQVSISNDTLRHVILGTYQTKDPSIKYDFQAIGADVLGNIYEQYLGHILKKTPLRAKLTNGKAHRKEQGIYYTPTYIVDYIVRNTVGEKLKQRKVKLDELKILDPACGSGSFLLKVFDAICEHEIKKEGKTLQAKFEDTSDGKLLKRKTELLKNCIFGVDLDTQAVEITQLNLLLKLAEKRHRLPTLQENIKCGNSLIDVPEIAGDKAFKWEEQFKEIMKEGRFDVIIGNPPYVKESVNRKIFEDVKKGSSRVAKYYEGKMDYLYFFIELGIDLLKEEGYLSFITTDYWLNGEGARKLREKILQETTILSIFEFNEFKVFEGTGQHNLILVLQKKKGKSNKINVSVVRDKNITKSEIIDGLNSRKQIEKIDNFKSKPQKEFLKETDFKIPLTNHGVESICQKIKNQQNYHFADKDIYSGIDVLQDKVTKNHLAKLQNKEVGDGVFVLSDLELKQLKLNKKEMELIKPYYTAKEIARYNINKNKNEWIIYTKSDINSHIDDYPKIREHLDKYKQIMTSAFKPYGLHRARKEEFFLGEKILCVRKTKQPSFSYVNFPSYVSRMFISIKPKENIDLVVLTGVLNSKLIHFWLFFKGKKEGNQLQVDINPILEMPIKIPTKSEQQSIASLVDKMLSLNKRLNEIGDKKTDERARIEDEIKKTDNEIDQLVYKLYGLTKEEIAIVEESLK